ncbi:MAG: hypothetical protein BWY80_01233 [Firmicutes bacterium ADurb.Bin456]|nr:MAG: hypothetical protein BWY80_01233 [Firmicutes bacterium ADurb.Bin456]
MSKLIGNNQVRFIKTERWELKLNMHNPTEFKEERGGNAAGREKQSRFRPGYWLLAFILWAVMVFGGFYLAKQYFDQTIMAVQQTNAVNIQTLEARLDNLGANVKEIKESLEVAGITLSSSGLTQKELNKKIEELDSQLKDLEKSLKILREAPR